MDEFALNNNMLSGSLPTELGLLTKLESFKVAYNNLNGTIPSEYVGMSVINILSMSYNDLEGSIPTEFSLLTSVTIFGASNNKLLINGNSIISVCSEAQLTTCNIGGTNQIICPSQVNQINYLLHVLYTFVFLFPHIFLLLNFILLHCFYKIIHQFNFCIYILKLVSVLYLLLRI